MNCFITKKGKIIDCNGEPHSLLCKRQFGIDLYDYLTIACRIMFYRDKLAIETRHKLTKEEIKVIKKLLKNNNIYSVVCEVNGKFKVKNSFRPVRSINWINN